MYDEQIILNPHYHVSDDGHYCLPLYYTDSIFTVFKAYVTLELVGFKMTPLTKDYLVLNKVVGRKRKKAF